MSMASKSNIINMLHKIPLFKNLSQFKLQALAGQIDIKNYSRGDKIVTEGEEGNQFFIVKEGEIEFLVKGEFVRSCSKNDFFGERSLLLREPRSATAVAKNDVEC